MRYLRVTSSAHRLRHLLMTITLLRHLLLTSGTDLLRRLALVIQHFIGALSVDVSEIEIGAFRRQQFLRLDVVQCYGKHLGRNARARRRGVHIEGLVVQEEVEDFVVAEEHS